tara:strand:- start:20249 stop:20728 length:480 start_codon:yes stop_codon:yes gene_type:complete
MIGKVLRVLPLAMVAACATPDASDDVAPALTVSYEATFDSVLPGAAHNSRQTSQVVLAHGQTFDFTLEDLPDGAFDMGQVGSGQRLDLHVNLSASRLDSGEISYAVRLTTQPAGGGETSPLAEPSLVVAAGETATVHLGQDGGEFHTGFTLDLQAVPVQ